MLPLPTSLIIVLSLVLKCFVFVFFLFRCETFLTVFRLKQERFLVMPLHRLSFPAYNANEIIVLFVGIHIFVYKLTLNYLGPRT